MTVDDAGLQRLVESFQEAALGTGSWMDALDGLAKATGSKGGQLIGLGSEAAVPFNWITEFPQEGLEEFVAVDGGDPQVNPRVRAGLRAPELKTLAESDFFDPDERLRPEYAAFVERYDIPFICLTNLHRENGITVGLSVVRSRAQGHIEAEERRLFSALAPHVRNAVSTQMALQSQGAALVAGAMEALSMAVFVCDGQGVVQAVSPMGEAVLQSGQHLRLRRGRIAAVSETDTRMISAALRSAAFATPLGVRPPTVLVVRDATGADPLLLEVATVPGGKHSFGLGVAALLIVRSAHNAQARAAMIARTLYSLTQAEADVVADLVAGLNPQSIAERAGVSVGTIRTHIRHIFEKAEVRSQIELVAAITSRL